MPTGALNGLQTRAVFFAFEGGTGIGHLKRLACLARRLQGRFSCLLVTGHRAAADWFVPAECEYVHLPSWDSLLDSKSSYWGREPFLRVDESEAVRLRRELVNGVVAAFRPGVIFVDHLPLGSRGELADVISTTPCLKYLVTRGVLNESADMDQLMFHGPAYDYLRSHYHRVLVASDSAVFDFSSQYGVSDELRTKIVHTGYLTEPLPDGIIETTRADRGLASDDTWVVASAGGGQLGEALIERCLDVAKNRPRFMFDIVLGPRSRLPWHDRNTTVSVGNNVCLHRQTDQMPYLNASADLVISSGGYNSLLEALRGHAKILCFPLWKDRRDEQYRHASLLKRFADIEVSMDLDELPALFDSAVASLGGGRPRDRRRELNFDGAGFIERLVLNNLASVAAEPAPTLPAQTEGAP